MEGSKQRTVKVGDDVVFAQEIGDQKGFFINVFANCSF